MMQERYEAYAKRRQELTKEEFGSVFTRQERRYVHPFHLYGPVWYVGDSWVCVHLIDTGDGLLLIDSGNCGATAMLVQAIWEAGFRPQDVRWIIHSHGHMDHIGGANFFKRMFGTKLYLGEPDAVNFRERPELSLIQETHNDEDVLFEPDEVIRDGDVLTFGKITIECVLCPGHTDGVLSLFFEADGEEGVKRFGYYGGFGFNTLRASYLREIGDTEFRMRQVYLESLKKVRDRRVDIMLGNHCDNNDTLGKGRILAERPDGPNPFVDPEHWQRYLDGKRDELLAFMADPRNL